MNIKTLFFLLIFPVPVFSQTIQPANTIPILRGDSKATIISKAAQVVPTANQYAALRNEFIAFVHLGPNTFTRKEWGNGMEDPKVFDLKTLDTDQWCTAMKAAGMKMVILTVKHHDGFVLWQSRYTTHGIMSTGFRNGKGDILKDLSASCKKYGLKLGIYLSPADLFQIESPNGLYGNLSKYTRRTIPRPVAGRPFKNKTTFQFEVDDYNEYFMNQLFELLTEYGPVDEVWFDGAHPKTKGGQQYNYAAWKKLIHTLAPKAVIFGKQDIRWCGNEAGKTRSTEWNVIPFKNNPDQMNSYPDLTANDLGSREQLYKARYLHYQQAETNTSIREGWFYRDETAQKVRSADDVFDIYERAVGGNSTFLLNIPPNREGRFSNEDVAVLNEAGNRIRKTYGVNLFKNATGPKPVLDADPLSFASLKGSRPVIIIHTPRPVTINRLVLQEAITTQGERVEQHAVDAWINGQWKEIAAATNIGYKRILRFPETTSNQFRIRILHARATPAISNITAHYYKMRPPQLQLSRSVTGMVSIAPYQPEFNWKPHGENAMHNLGTGFELHYTTNGKAPNRISPLYTGPFPLANGQVKAVAISRNGTGPVASQTFGILKQDWKLLAAGSTMEKHGTALAFDANEKTWWQSNPASGHGFMALDLGKAYTLKRFSYTPQTQTKEGLMSKGKIQISTDGSNWTDADSFEFGNLINDPVTRIHPFPRPLTTRYIRIAATETAADDARLSIAELDFFE
ncbi:alpha-L-fucosidase [Niabella aurantiaca]|uniref:alpha-L-fucosidase n=1 Tax=Niabella aurantiaca TaxID=379900 RepID=UPI000378492F|nr:alpha-L-fucosidase [Niabella aurantiaca]